MKSNSLKYLVIAIAGMFSTQMMAQLSTPPAIVTSSISEAVGAGCGEVTNCAEGKICFDVSFEVDQPGWNLQAYNIWMTYGDDNSVLSYKSDGACHHDNGGEVNLDQYGKYRFLAAQMALPLEANQSAIIHNFCVNIQDNDALKGLKMGSGNNHFQLYSSVNLVDQIDEHHAVHKQVKGSLVTLDHSTLSCIKQNQVNTNANIFDTDLDGNNITEKVVIDHTDANVNTTNQTVYPVPFINELNFNLGTPGKYTVELYSITGELVERAEVNSNGTITTDKLTAGVYLLKAKDSEGTEVYSDTIVKAN